MLNGKCVPGFTFLKNRKTTKLGFISDILTLCKWIRIKILKSGITQINNYLCQSYINHVLSSRHNEIMVLRCSMWARPEFRFQSLCIIRSMWSQKVFIEKVKVLKSKLVFLNKGSNSKIFLKNQPHLTLTNKKYKSVSVAWVLVRVRCQKKKCYLKKINK